MSLPLHVLDNPHKRFERQPLFAENANPDTVNPINFGNIDAAGLRQWGLQIARPFLVPERGETLTGNRLSFMAKTAGRSIEVFVGMEGSLWRLADPLLDNRPYGQQVICSGEDAPHWVSKYAVITERYRVLRLYSMRSLFAEQYVNKVDRSQAEVKAVLREGNAKETRVSPVQENSSVVS